MKYVYQLMAEGGNCLGGYTTMYSNTVFSSYEAAEKRVDKFKLAVEDSSQLIYMTKNGYKVIIKELEIVE